MAAYSFNFCLLAFIFLTLSCFTADAINMENLKANSKGGNTNDGPFNTNSGNIFGARGFRSFYGVGPRMLQTSRSNIPMELDMLVENDENDRLKRFDDYGHMRFGKRGGEEQFDDYGHMRFGRSV